MNCQSSFPCLRRNEDAQKRQLLSLTSLNVLIDMSQVGDDSLLQLGPLLLLSSRSWDGALADRLSKRLDRPVEIITSPCHLTQKAIERINPQWIFVPHWSNLIPESIWGAWPTVIFHMTDLPYGRGGSPLQNLIVRGRSTTMISALRCGSGLDTGDIYLKERLDLFGTAEEIFLRVDALIELMIERIVREDPVANLKKVNQCCLTVGRQTRVI